MRKLPRVELLNVPSYRQGSFDGLCAYYTAAMMLSALFPEYSTRFGETNRKRATKKLAEDPLITNQDGDDHRKVLAKWFYQGEHVEKVTIILNRIMKSDGKDTKFVCLGKTARDSTFDKTIADSIDLGLPVMLGWNTHDYGDHAVLVTGYWEGREKWLLVNDPQDGASEISWLSLKRQKTANFEVGLCLPETHRGYRPLKSRKTASDQAPLVERWTKEGYEPVEKEFGEYS